MSATYDSMNAEDRSGSPLGMLGAWLFVLAFAVFLNNTPAPSSQNEEIYLVGAYKYFHPAYLARDWVFLTSWPENTVFNLVVGFFTQWFSIPAVVWGGRVLSYGAMLWALLRIGRRFGLPVTLVAVAIAVWLAAGQSFVGGERIIAGFEGKAIGCALLLVGVDQLMMKRYFIGGALMGASFSVHPAVGAVGGFAAVVALFTVDRPWRALMRTGLGILLLAGPGFIAALPTMLAEGGTSRDALRYLTLERMPFHFDALRFSRRELVALGLCFAFNVAHAWTRRDSAFFRWILAFQVGLLIIFVVGFLARIFEVFEILKITPFRLFPVLVPLFFFFHLFSALRQPVAAARRPVLAILGVAALLAQRSPFGVFGDQMHQRAEHWQRHTDDLATTFDWVAANTPDTVIALLPPWRKDSYYRARRAQVISAEAYRYDQIDEYRTRLEAVVGKSVLDQPGAEPMSFERMQVAYAALPADSVLALSRRYGATWLVSSTRYPFTEHFRAGDVAVYELPAP